MFYHRGIGPVFFMVLLTATSLSAYSLLGTFYTTSALAQSRNLKKEEADKIMEQGDKVLYQVQFDYTRNDSHDRKTLLALEDSLKDLKRALTIYREVGNYREEIYALNMIGAIHRELRNFDQAITSFEQSLNIHLKIFAQEYKEKNIPDINPSLDPSYLDSVSIIQISKDLASLYFTKENYQGAAKYYQKALSFSQKIDNSGYEASSLQGIGHAYQSMGNYDKATDYYRQALAKIVEHDSKVNLYSHIDRSKILADLGASLFESGNLIEAERALLFSIQEIESLRKGIGYDDFHTASSFESQIRPYNLLQQIFVARNTPKAALEISELSRARTFVSSLAKQLPEHASSQSFTRFFEIEKIQETARLQDATIVMYSVRFDDKSYHELSPRPDELGIFIWAIKPSGEISFREVDLSSLHQKQKLNLWIYITIGFILAIAIMVVCFLTMRNRLRIVAVLAIFGCLGGLVFLGTTNQRASVTRSSETIQTQQSDSLLAELIDSTRKDIGVGSRSLLEMVEKNTNRSPEKGLELLHQLLIQPIADFLPTDPTERVIFVPHEELFFVPFPALKTPEGQYLIEKHTMLTAPSIQALNLIHKRKQKNSRMSKEAIVVGNPTMPQLILTPGDPPTELEPLPASSQEARDIARILDTEPLIGDQATETTIVLKLSQARIIHLATHGLLANFQAFPDIEGNSAAFPGAVVLATSSKDDGFLTTGEILSLKLNADLVVLSACDTGLGRVSNEGVMGLAYSFLTAGVPSAIVSLWQVPDTPTSELMTEFYKNLEVNPDKAQALRQAMLTTKEKYPDPWTWAAFTLIGEAE